MVSSMAGDRMETSKIWDETTTARPIEVYLLRSFRESLHFCFAAQHGSALVSALDSARVNR
jgi:hypothetical protein